MIQTVIVLIIIAISIVYSISAVIKNIRKKETSACGDCNGCDIKREITKNLKTPPLKDPTTCGCAPK